MTENVLEVLEKEDKFFSRKTGMHLFGYSFMGGISNSLEIGLLFVLVECCHFWYLLASVCVFTFGSALSFILRRFFVFKKRGLVGIKMQISSYIFIYMLGICMNSLIMAFFVEAIKVHYVIAYIIAVLMTGI